MEKGYHYSTEKNWLRIQKVGLLPHFLSNEAVYTQLSYHGYYKRFKGIWLWSKRLRGVSHVGTLLNRATSHSSTRMVLLEVQYPKEDLFSLQKYSTIVFPHEGSIGNWKYHTQEEAKIVIKPIPPENIKLLKSYNLLDLLR